MLWGRSRSALIGLLLGCPAQAVAAEAVFIRKRHRQPRGFFRAPALA